MPKRLHILSLILALGLLALPLPAGSQDSGPIYIVQPGDTLSAIARRFGISQETIINVNAITDPSRLFPGEVLVLPGFPGIEGELGLRTIELGETLTSLSRHYAVSIQDLGRLNRIVRADAVYAGQALIVPVQEEDNALATGAFSRLIQRGETRLELAGQVGISTWEPTPQNQSGIRFWQLPGTLFFDEGPSGSTALPSLIEELSITPFPLIQGKTTIMRVTIPDGFGLSGSLGESEITFFPDGDGHWLALQGIHALTEPGLLNLSIDVTQENEPDPVYSIHQRVLIDEGDYGFQYLSGVPPETVDPEIIQPEDDLVRSLLAPRTENKLWSGAFEFPSRYYTEEFISTFGTRRNYNNGALLYYHTGLDFYGQNIPVYAPADGIVVYADFLTIRGNVTYLDHGWGVYSGYLHQNEISVEVGDRVERGQVIGQVGATGRVTGPHLHWEIWVGGVPVEPMDWVLQTIP